MSSRSSGNWRLARPLVLALLSVLFARSALAASTTASTSAFGESIVLHLVPPAGPAIDVTNGPLPSLSGNRSANGTLGSFKAAGALGSVLEASLMQVATFSPSPAMFPVLADSTIGDLKLRLIGSASFFQLKSDVVTSRALISCAGQQPVATGAVSLANARLNGVSLLDRPAPNTVILDTGTIRVVLNEQVLSVNGETADLVVNAIHVSIQQLSITGVGVLSAEILLGQSHAYLASCA